MAYTDKNKLRVVYGDYTLGVHGDGFDYIFSYSQGGLESMTVKKLKLLWMVNCKSSMLRTITAMAVMWLPGK